MEKKSVRALAFALAAVLLVLIGVYVGKHLLKDGIAPAQKARASSGAETAVMMNAASADGAAVGATLSSAEADDGRKIVRTAQLDVESKDLDAALAAVQMQVAQAGGTIDYSEISGQKGEGRFASLEVRVPSELLDDFLSGAGSLGKVTRRVTKQSDMTSQYMDNASRLDSAQAQKQRLDELYAQAQDMTDIVTITDALFDVQQEIDSLTGANAWIDERAAFSRVNLYLTEPAEGETRIPFLTQLVQSVKDGCEAIGGFFGTLALVAAWALPWMALLALSALAVVLIRGRKRN